MPRSGHAFGVQTEPLSIYCAQVLLCNGVESEFLLERTASTARASSLARFATFIILAGPSDALTLLATFVALAGPGAQRGPAVASIRDKPVHGAWASG